MDQYDPNAEEHFSSLLVRIEELEYQLTNLFFENDGLKNELRIKKEQLQEMRLKINELNKNRAAPVHSSFKI